MANEMTNQQPFDLRVQMHRLLMDEPFFAAISRRVNKTSTTSIPTAGVYVDKESLQFNLLYNPNFFADKTDVQIKGVLMHEFYHLIFKHVTSRKPENVPNMTWNIAADLAINCMIGEENLPPNCCIPEVGRFKDYPAHKTAEFYLEMMKKDEEFGDGKGGFKEMDSSGEFGNFDDHQGWDDLTDEERQIIEERSKDILEKAVREVNQGNNWGSVSSSVKREIMERLKTRVDWKKVLRAFIGASQRADKTNTMRKINRRFPYIHAGRKVNRVANIAISIDQSGSVSDAELNAFFNELNKLATLATFTVIPFDYEVAEQKVYVWKKGDKRKWERVLYGGTNFDAPTAYVNERNFDGHIILTDLMADKPKSSRCRRMWMASKHNVDHMPFKINERVIAIDVLETA
jgi:predicted metal-dependent peptidase